MIIKLEQFEGPLNLLLQLIEKEEMDITKISLAKITDEYINYIRTNDIDSEHIADFLVVAAKLLLIKSRALLPYLYPEETEEIEEFENQLKMYKEFLEATKKIEKMIGKKKFMFVREFNRQAVLAGAKVFSPPKKLVAADLHMVFQDLLNRVKVEEKLEEQTLEPKISIDDKIAYLRKTIFQGIKIKFKKLMELAESKTEVIVSFLAMLELIKQREVVVEQEELFGEIEINKIQ